MAWETGTYACGHTGREQFYGKHKDREYAIQKHFEKVCPECWQAECERNAKDAAEKNKTAALPILRGSDKQIAWAESIRANLVGKDGFVLVLRNDSAKWWIDNRNELKLFGDSRFLTEKLELAKKLVKEGKLAKPETPISLEGLYYAEAVKVAEEYINHHRILA